MISIDRIAINAYNAVNLENLTVTMTSITIRKLDDEVKKRLRVRAALNDRSMEEEARLILRDALMSTSTSNNLAEAIRSHFGSNNGVDLELPPRDPVREPPSFD